jgi:hypothetical protein
LLITHSGGFEMLTIQHNYWADLATARKNINLFYPKRNPTKVELYQGIAKHLGINPDGMDIGSYSIHAGIEAPLFKQCLAASLTACVMAQC